MAASTRTAAAAVSHGCGRVMVLSPSGLRDANRAAAPQSSAAPDPVAGLAGVFPRTGTSVGGSTPAPYRLLLPRFLVITGIDLGKHRRAGRGCPSQPGVAGCGSPSLPGFRYGTIEHD